jgi:predicted exporter
MEAFIAKEPPILVGFLALLLINGAVGLTWALFFRETSSGPGGEFNKGVVALRKVGLYSC